MQIAYGERALRERVKAAGGRWNGERKLWIVRGEVVRRLQLEDRIAAWIEAE